MEDDRYTRITLRIPRDLHARLQLAADMQSHSQNAEIVARLESSFSSAQQVAPIEVIQGYKDLAENLLAYLLRPVVPSEHVEQLKPLTEALHRATEEALAVLQPRT